MVDAPGPARGRRGPVFWLLGALVALLALAALLLAGGYTYEVVTEVRDRGANPPPGELIDVGGFRLHLLCRGEGSPTVLLDAMQPGTVSSWVWVLSGVERVTRVCAYDRAGLGWSEPGPLPRDARHNAEELETLLQRAKVAGPYVLVGHSLGGLHARVFAGRHPEQVRGLVLVDATHPDAWRRLGLPEGVGMDKGMLDMGVTAARFGLLRVVSFVPVAPALPERQQAELRAYYASPGFAENARDVDDGFPALLAQGREVDDLGDLPLVVLTTGEIDRASDGAEATLRELQHDLVRLSTNGRYQVVDGASHVSLVTDPRYAGAVIDAIEEVVREARSG